MVDRPPPLPQSISSKMLIKRITSTIKILTFSMLLFGETRVFPLLIIFLYFQMVLCIFLTFSYVYLLRALLIFVFLLSGEYRGVRECGVAVGKC